MQKIAQDDAQRKRKLTRRFVVLEGVAVNSGGMYFFSNISPDVPGLDPGLDFFSNNSRDIDQIFFIKSLYKRRIYSVIGSPQLLVILV